MGLPSCTQKVSDAPQLADLTRGDRCMTKCYLGEGREEPADKRKQMRGLIPDVRVSDCTMQSTDFYTINLDLVVSYRRSITTTQ